jgi:hypothetical protein
MKPWFSGVSVGIALALVTGVALRAVDDVIVSQPRTLELTEVEQRSHLVYTEPTGEITVIFMPPDEIKRRHKNNTRAYSTLRFDGVGSCKIYLPISMPIMFWNDMGQRPDAAFLNEDDARTVAHELLHCLRWNWH